MKANYLININLDQPLDIERSINRDEIGKLGQSIHDDSNAINTMSSARKTTYKIYSDTLPIIY